jgi:hypothetical protein
MTDDDFTDAMRLIGDGSGMSDDAVEMAQQALVPVHINDWALTTRRIVARAVLDAIGYDGLVAENREWEVAVERMTECIECVHEECNYDARAATAIDALVAERDAAREQAHSINLCMIDIERREVALVEENARQRACLSWITGACVDEAPYADISAAIDRCVTPLMFAKDDDG